MIAKLNAEPEAGDQVDDEDCIHLNRVSANYDVEHPHAAHKLEEN